MKKQKYIYKSEPSLHLFEFVSEGKNGLIKKMVEFSKTGTENIYNLAFGDYDEATNTINDLSVSNNGDSIKVLATVASIVYVFMEKYPETILFATGSTSVRTRLYRMGITNNLDEIQDNFNVYGLNLDEKWEIFITGEDYLAFLITRKENKLII